jgi:hypothetical protein
MCGRFLVKYQKDGLVYLEANCYECRGTITLEGDQIRFREKQRALTANARCGI